MDETVISANGLGKQYWLRHGTRPDTLRDTVIGAARNLGARLRGHGRHGGEEEFWALRDVSFAVTRGEVVGIIGRNGAGKSTLLKVLSRITEPTKGEIRLRGRVASLLEVGTGFHPELTGRENIFLNGAILGMSRAEIRVKFDEIVAFAEVERFLDMQVKHYSSGMYMRLAFAVAAHLESEILIVDEVLAVGDAAFQRKCLGKMGEVARGGSRAVLFVSHNMDSVLRLCNSCILLAEGRTQFAGSTSEAIALYAHARHQQAHRVECRDVVRPAWTRGRIRVDQITHLDSAQAAWTVPFGTSLRLSCDLIPRESVSELRVFIAIFSMSGVEVAATESQPLDLAGDGLPRQLFCELADLRLTPDSYLLNLGIIAGTQMEDLIPSAVTIEILATAVSSGLRTDSYRGYYVPVASFRLA